MRIRTWFGALFLTLAALAFVPRLVLQPTAQTSLTSTTISAALTDTFNRVSLASATGVSVGSYLFVDREAMQVVALTGTVADVVRGFAGTQARAHAASAITYVGTPQQFYASEAWGPCTAANELVTPRIVLPSGNLYTCTGGYWNKLGADVGTTQVMFQQGATPADALDTTFFIADRPYLVSKITAVWGTAESTGSMDIDVEKLTGTTACASGTSLNTAIAATGTANTVTTATLTATAANLLLATGDRLCVDLTATPNEVANMVVTVTLVPR